tara:strand:- start:299 stop:427 length:129 start_codon:yes stop_codon:yes gene_type:complete
MEKRKNVEDEKHGEKNAENAENAEKHAESVGGTMRVSMWATK